MPYHACPACGAGTYLAGPFPGNEPIAPPAAPTAPAERFCPRSGCDWRGMAPAIDDCDAGVDESESDKVAEVPSAGWLDF